MIKVMSLMKRKDGMSFEDFRSWLEKDHPKLAKNIPGMRKYTVNILAKSNDELPFDGVSEMWFDNEAAIAEGFRHGWRQGCRRRCGGPLLKPRAPGDERTRAVVTPDELACRARNDLAIIL